MAKSSKEYWEDRERENLEKNLKTEAEYFKEVESIYKYTMGQIQREIDSFYARYATKEGISIAEAKKRASELDIEAYAEKAKKYVKEKNFSKQANDEMRLYNLTMKVNRLELLKAQIGLELVAGFDELQQFYEEKLTERTMEEFQRLAGILGLTILDNAKMADAIVNASFKNATFSERIWAHQDLLRAELEKLLRTGLIQGRNPRELARQLRRVFDASIFNSERLLRTELARVQTEAQKQSYIRNGFDQYTYITCSDGKVCSECKLRNGKHYDVDKMMVGENAPPMHPCCRCSTAAYMDDKSYNEWLYGYKDHGLSYAEWKAKNVENFAGSDKIIKKRNGGSKKSDMEYKPLGEIGAFSSLEQEFGALYTKDIIITDERALHIKERHAEDYELFEKYGKTAVKSPDIVVKDGKNEATVFMIKRLPETNLNVVVKVAVDVKHPKYKNSVITFYRLRNKNLKKMMEKEINKVIYKNE